MTFEPEKNCREGQKRGDDEALEAWSKESLRESDSGSGDRNTEGPAKGSCFSQSALKSLGGLCGC